MTSNPEHNHDTEDEPRADGIWVRTTCDENGDYLVVAEFDPDTVHPMDRVAGREYADTLASAAAAALHYTAVARQLIEVMELTPQAAIEIISRLRHERGRREWSAGPLVLIPSIARRIPTTMQEMDQLDYFPIVKCSAGKHEWEWSPDLAIAHANQVLQMSALAEYESRYHRFLRDKFEVADRDMRLAMVAGLGRFMSSDAPQDEARDEAS